jgi:hypothetical protein
VGVSWSARVARGHPASRPCSALPYAHGLAARRTTRLARTGRPVRVTQRASARARSSRADRVAMTSRPCSVTSPRARPQVTDWRLGPPPVRANRPSLVVGGQASLSPRYRGRTGGPAGAARHPPSPLVQSPGRLVAHRRGATASPRIRWPAPSQPLALGYQMAERATPDARTRAIPWRAVDVQSWDGTIARARRSR